MLWFAGLVCLPLWSQGVPAAGPAFSHRLHLGEAGATCTDCHVAAPTSTAATDRLLPQPQSCAACHDGSKAPEVDASWLGQEATAERIYRFNHEFHLQMGNTAPIISAAVESGAYLGKHEDSHHHMTSENACESCHRGMRETALASTANLPKMADCLVCHSEIDNPFTCSTCHLEGANLMPADHTEDYIDGHSTGRADLDKQSCLPCHGRRFTCRGCH